MPNQPTTLLVHIGFGKTGTSSIQTFLRESSETLSDAKQVYLGTMLEFAGVQSGLGWQVPHGHKIYAKTRDRNKGEQLYSVIKAELARCQELGIRTAIWSNETFCSSNNRLLPILKRLEDEGHPVRPVCYVRRHDKWSISAYEQWGLKHKIYRGPIMSYREWVQHRPVRFYTDLKEWEASFGNALEVYNYDACVDVVDHFAGMLGLREKSAQRRNEAEGAELLFMRAAYNNTFANKKQKSDFDRLILRALRHGRIPTMRPFEELYPDEGALAELRDDVKEDLLAVNRLLESRGQPKLEMGPSVLKDKKPNQEHLNELMLRLIFFALEELSSRAPLSEPED